MTGEAAAPSVPLARLVSLEDRVAVVTGGRRGIGQAIARRLLEAGAKVVIADLEGDGAAETARDLGPGERVVGRELDVRDPGSVVRCCDAVERDLGQIDVWVNNAGIFPQTPLLGITSAEWSDVLATNLTGIFNCSVEVGRRMAARRSSGSSRVIVNLGSAASFRSVRPGLAHYTASKHGVVGLTKSMARELGPSGVRVLGVAPTVIETEGLAEQRRSVDDAGDPHAEVVSRILLGRRGRPDDVARVVLFCASDLSAFMTGATLPVDGGFLCT